MKRSVIACLTALTTLSLTSCLSTKEPTCNSNGYVPIVNVFGPKTATLSQPAVFTLSYTLGNDCTKLTNVEVVPSASGNITQVNLAASSNGCACNATTTVSQTSYQFQPTKAGTYYIQFLTTNNAFITDTVVVN
jgi:hypothetical protein